MAYFRKRGDKWSYTVNLGIDTITKKRKLSEDKNSGMQIFFQQPLWLG